MSHLEETPNSVTKESVGTASPNRNPVRIVLRTNSIALTKIDSSLDGATRKLEQQLHADLRGDPDLKDLRCVLTRLSDKRGHGGGDLTEIVFDSPIMDTFRPKVIVYRVTLKGSRPYFEEVHRPGIEEKVNRIVRAYKQTNPEPSLPETIDVRRKTRIQRGLIDTSNVH